MRRGRPAIPPEQRRRSPSGASGPSGRHCQVSGAELAEQRRAVLSDLPSPWSELDPLEPLPLGAPRQIAAAIGWPERAGAERVRQVWAGKRRYRRVVKIF